jgi:hypothetical protein
VWYRGEAAAFAVLRDILLFAGNTQGLTIRRTKPRHHGVARHAPLHALAALIPRPRANLTLFHGIFAPNSKYRALVTPAKRGKGNNREENCKPSDYEPANRHAAMVCTRGHKGTTPQAGIQYRYYNL